MSERAEKKTREEKGAKRRRKGHRTGRSKRKREEGEAQTATTGVNKAR